MGLPEYKNDAPLYSDNSKDSELEDLKFGFSSLLSAAFVLGFVAFVLYVLFNFFQGVLY